MFIHVDFQVLIRIRPLSTMERVSQGYGRCLKQESTQTLQWLGHAESRFTFDHVACETISQVPLNIHLLISFFCLKGRIMYSLHVELCGCLLEFGVGKAVQSSWTTHGGELHIWV